MRKYIISIILLIGSIFVFMPSVSAINPIPVCNSATVVNTGVCKAVNSQAASGNDPILHILKTVIGILGIIIGVASVIVIMIAGLTFITNGSDAQAVSRARNMLIYAIIGVFISVLSESIVAFILKTV